MGFGYPMYELPQVVYDTVLDLIEKTKQASFPADKLPEITHRPIRPDEININLTQATRVYDTNPVPAAFGYILGATADAVVPAGSVFLHVGWIIVDDPAATIGLDAVARVRVEGVIRNELAPAVVNNMENNSYLTLDQVVVVGENTRIAWECKSPSGGGAAHAIIYPLAYRIGPKSQLDVS